MKPKFSQLFLIACSSLLAISSSHAATLYWDGGNVDILTDGDGASNSCLAFITLTGLLSLIGNILLPRAYFAT